MGQSVQLKRSSVVTNGNPKLPQASQLDFGELAINFAAGHETMSIKNSNSAITTFSSDNINEAKFASASVVSAMASLFDDAEYDSNSKRINFKHGGNVVDYIDATDFIKDGMVSSVTIDNENLVISFNTDAGREDISLALAQIFNPNNYYDKTAADAKFLSAYTETDPIFTGSPAYGITSQNITDWGNKQDAINDLAAIRYNATSGMSAYNTVTAHTGNTAIHVPTVSSSDNGKILQVVNGVWTLVTPVTIYTGDGTPASSLGNDGDIYLQTS